MSAVLQAAARPLARRKDAQPHMALLGTGTVGSAVVERCIALRARGVAVPGIGWIGNSRGLLACGAAAGAPGDVLATARGLPGLPFDVAASLASSATSTAASAAASFGTSTATSRDPLALLRRGDIAIDATASDTVADWHASWLARGVHVVTANKLGTGASAARASDIATAALSGNARYGDSATVGAGLPLLSAIRALRAGGDRIHAIEGVLSGSLAWLFDRYDGMRPFSGFVRQARDAGYTEPDPRIDLSGEDVRRKLLILARAAGVSIDAADVQVASLVPHTLAACDAQALDAALPALDAALREQFQAAYRDGARLRFIGQLRIDGDGRVTAAVGLRALAHHHPLCGGSGTDNRVAIHSDRYATQPLVIQGPGAGAGVTAAALLDDVLGLPPATPH